MRTVFEVYLRPWRDYAKAGGRGVMASHNMINWVPCHANKKMLTDTLRDRFGLDNGYIGSDNENVDGLAVGEAVILLHPLPPLQQVFQQRRRGGCQQNDSLAAG